MVKPSKPWSHKIYNGQSNPADFIRLFVIVRTDIPYEHQAVQAGHAALQYVMNHSVTVPFNRDCFDRDAEYPWTIGPPVSHIYDDKYIGHNFTWDNGTLIYLAVDNELELIKWQKKLNDWGVQNAMFEEPDWRDRLIPTALASIGFKGDFSELSLLKMPKGFFAHKCKSERLEIE